MASKVLTDFIDVLRAADVPVSTAETLDALQVADSLGYGDRARLKAGLSLALAKDAARKRVFDACFEQYFRFAPASGDDNDPASEHRPDVQDSGQRGQAGGASSAGGNNLSELSAQLLQGSDADQQLALARALEQAQARDIKVITQKGLVGRRVYQALGGDGLDDDIRRLSESGAVADRQLENALRARRDQVRASIREQVAREFLMRGARESRALRERAMRASSLRDLSDFRDVRAQIEKMARRLVAMHSRRQRRMKRGILDARRTVTASVPLEGVPGRLYWRDRRRNKARLFVICDVSSSVQAAARFLLLFLAAVNDVLPRTRSFVFAARFAEVTDLFSQFGPDDAVDEILDTWAGSGTDYAAMFEQFLAASGRQLDRRSTVIILGDGRNNDMPAGQQYLAAIQARAKQVLWLNPEGQWRWGSGDSEVPAYRPYCTRMSTCATLADLERFVADLLRALQTS
ncbi:MAG: VWA domain-containing protein [Alcanivoracaceae bacterium]|nr:VWA domain-containing protein [Alcanivoracaceae bacterium]